VIGVTIEDVRDNLKVGSRHVSMDAPFDMEKKTVCWMCFPMQMNQHLTLD
jgi:hypothetical protein